jgi:hypothetical protein
MANRLVLSMLLVAAGTVGAQEAPPSPPANDSGDVVFRSDTTLVRVDIQVMQGGRPVTGLGPESFVLKEQGQVRRIMNFVAEEMPIDVVFLIDVSGSMRPHVERMADAARDAVPSMMKQDRVAIMVFDRMSRVRMPFRATGEARREFEHLLRTESFNGGTDVTRALLDAAQFVKRHGRKEARHAIVMLTDDQTEFEADEPRVVRALTAADSVLSVLLVPNAIGMGGGYPRRRGGGYPGGGGGWPGRGGVIIGIPGGGGWPGGGGGYPGGGGGGSRTQSAGSAEIARETGGDAMQATEASALQDTLDRLRQRYALHFNLPAGARAGERRTVEVTLHSTLARQYPDAEVRYRRTYVAAETSAESEPQPVSEPEEATISERSRTSPQSIPADEPQQRRRRTTSDGGGGGAKGPIIH